jgi:hypothetical protein
MVIDVFSLFACAIPVKDKTGIIKILLTHADDIAGSRDLSIGVGSFLDILVSW